MRLLYLARVCGLSHMRRKAKWQAEGLAKCCPDFHAYAVSDTPLGNDDMGPVNLVYSEHANTDYVRIFASISKAVKPDLIFMRYPLANAQLYEFVNQYPNVVFEHNTIEEFECTGEILAQEKMWGDALLPKISGLAAVTDEILEYERKRSRPDIPGFVLGNGINPQSVPILSYRHSRHAIHLLCMGLFYHWLGLERLFKGLNSWKGPERFYLHIAGVGEEMYAYKQAVQQMGLEDKVFFHGYMQKEQLYKLASGCHLGVGTLNPGSKRLSEIASLKHREYCALGLPFFYVGKDVDFPLDAEFAMSVPSNEMVDMEAVAGFCRSVHAMPDIHRKMRAYAEETLGWDAKCEKLYRFLDEIHQGRQTA